jgi:hypothetical protein
MPAARTPGKIMPRKIRAAAAELLCQIRYGFFRQIGARFGKDTARRILAELKNRAWPPPPWCSQKQCRRTTGSIP